MANMKQLHEKAENIRDRRYMVGTNEDKITLIVRAIHELGTIVSELTKPAKPEPEPEPEPDYPPELYEIIDKAENAGALLLVTDQNAPPGETKTIAWYTPQQFRGVLARHEFSYKAKSTYVWIKPIDNYLRKTCNPDQATMLRKILSYVSARATLQVKEAMSR